MFVRGGTLLLKLLRLLVLEGSSSCVVGVMMAVSRFSLGARPSLLSFSFALDAISQQSAAWFDLCGTKEIASLSYGISASNVTTSSRIFRHVGGSSERARPHAMVLIDIFWFSRMPDIIAIDLEG